MCGKRQVYIQTPLTNNCEAFHSSYIVYERFSQKKMCQIQKRAPLIVISIRARRGTYRMFVLICGRSRIGAAIIAFGSGLVCLLNK